MRDTLGPGASPDLAWLADVLWGGLEGVSVTLNAPPPAGARTVERYRVVPNARAPALLVPDARRAAASAIRAAAGSRSASTRRRPSRRGRRVRRRARGRRVQRPAPGPRRPRMRRRAIGSRPRSGRCWARPCCWPSTCARLRRRANPSCRSSTRTGRTLAYAKVGWSTGTDERLAAEGRALSAMAALTGRGRRPAASAPRVVARPRAGRDRPDARSLRRWRGRCAAAGHGDPRRRRSAGRRRLRGLRELARAGRPPRALGGRGTDGCRARARRRARRPAGRARSLLRRRCWSTAGGTATGPRGTSVSTGTGSSPGTGSTRATTCPPGSTCPTTASRRRSSVERRSGGRRVRACARGGRAAPASLRLLGRPGRALARGPRRRGGRALPGRGRRGRAAQPPVLGGGAGGHRRRKPHAMPASVAERPPATRGRPPPWRSGGPRATGRRTAAARSRRRSRPRTRAGPNGRPASPRGSGLDAFHQAHPSHPTKSRSPGIPCDTRIVQSCPWVPADRFPETRTGAP